MDQIIYNGRAWQKEWLFHVAKDCQAMIWLNRLPTRREVENIVAVLQLSLEQGVYDEEEKDGGQPEGLAPVSETPERSGG